ncbi:MAG: class I tRNA ligase family protein, partial [Dokdonella sp.]
YARYDFPEIVQRIQNFCTNEMGSQYLDITKDRLYTMPTDSLGRRSAQSAMYRILQALVRWLAPILSFTAEEIWALAPGRSSASVLLETWYDGLSARRASAEQRRWWSDLQVIRTAVSRLLEGMRNGGAIGASLQAEVTLFVDADTRQRYTDAADELHFYFITSGLKLADVDDKPADAVKVDLAGSEVWVSAVASSADKCVRCWHYVADVGSHADDPELCGRCIGNIEGPGETRRWF